MKPEDYFTKNFRPVCRSNQLTPAEKAVYNVLLSYCDAEGRCFPSQARLARQTPCSERRLRDYLATLERLGLIAIQRRARGHGSQYQVNRLTRELKDRLTGQFVRSTPDKLSA